LDAARCEPRGAPFQSFGASLFQIYRYNETIFAYPNCAMTLCAGLTFR
jgi:hypothetical protein